MKKFDDLDSCFRESENCDRNLFAEMRSNVLLVAGDHYTRRGIQNLYPSLRFSQSVSDDVRIRLTQNHLGRIMERLSESILSFTPDVAVAPHNRTEIADQKKAELYSSLKEDADNRYDLDQHFANGCDDFTRLGEVHTYIYFDPSLGAQLGVEPLVDETGQEVRDPMTGQPVPDPSRPVYEGDFVWERVYGFNLLRDPHCETLDKSPYLIMRKMGQKKDLKAKYKSDPAKLKFIDSTNERTFKIFESQSGTYRDSTEEEVLLRYFFYRPCFDYPKGYFYITTTMGILEEGELPLGLFPICSEIFDQIDTTPRGRSRIKRLRPYQGEVNRSASKMAEHQITLGDDKLIVIGNAKVSSGTDIPGIRTISVFGQVPTVIPGRNGSQYLDYMLQKIKEMYDVADVDGEEAPAGQLDAYALLFASARQRKRYGRYVGKYTSHKKRCYNLFFRLAKEFLPEARKVKIIGTGEIMNVVEFKSQDDISYDLVLEPGNEDLETRLGRQMILSQSLQYVGSQLSPDQIGGMLRAMPYANNEEAFGDLTLKYDKAKNVMLMLDRGMFVPPNQYDDHPYMIQKLTNRMVRLDFMYQPPNIQQLYAQCVAAHEQFEQQKQQQLQAAESQMIPMGGPRVKVDMYVNPDPNDPNKVTRAAIPQQALDWLFQKAEQQGVFMGEISQLPQASQLAIMNPPSRGAPAERGAPPARSSAPPRSPPA